VQHLGSWQISFIAILSCGLAVACQPTAPSPTAKPAETKPTAAAPAASPAASPAAKPAASPAASPAAQAPGPQPAARPPDPVVNVEEAARYFSGKTITVTVGFSPGGGYDTFARVMAEFMPSFIPGNPKVAVTNVPGAASLTAWQTVMRKAPGTGLDIALFSSGLITQAVLGEKLEAFDLDTPLYIGAPDFAPRRTTVCVRSELASGLDAFLKSPRKLKIAEAAQATGLGSSKVWLEVVGLPVQPVFGYGGTSELNVAFDRGELDMTDRCDDSNTSRFPHWREPGVATPLFYFEEMPEWIKPLLAQGKYPWFGKVFDVIKVTPDQREALEVNFSLSSGERLFALPPRTPDNVAAAIRKGFYDTVNDPTFQQEIIRRNFEVGLKTGDQVRQEIEDAKRLRPEVLAILHEMYRPRI